MCHISCNSLFISFSWSNTLNNSRRLLLFLNQHPRLTLNHCCNSTGGTCASAKQWAKLGGKSTSTHGCPLPAAWFIYRGIDDGKPWQTPIISDSKAICEKTDFFFCTYPWKSPINPNGTIVYNKEVGFNGRCFLSGWATWKLSQHDGPSRDARKCAGSPLHSRITQGFLSKNIGQNYNDLPKMDGLLQLTVTENYPRALG